MKLAVLSDVHGNLPALEAVLEEIVAWQPDRVILNGDLISRGPDSAGCLKLLCATLPEVHLLQGNHEQYVVESAAGEPVPGTAEFELTRFARWTADQLGGDTLSRLAAWPDHLDLTDLDGCGVHVTHGSRLGNRSGISASTRSEELPERLGDDPRDLFVVSHTHRPLLRSFNDTLIVNVGSVGTPMDGDVRAAYGRFTFEHGRWRAAIRRVDYDRARAERDFRDSGFLNAGGVFAQIIFAEFLQARVLAGPWMRRYHKAVLDGELGFTESVQRHLEEQGCAGMV